MNWWLTGQMVVSIVACIWVGIGLWKAYRIPDPLKPDAAPPPPASVAPVAIPAQPLLEPGRLLTQGEIDDLGDPHTFYPMFADIARSNADLAALFAQIAATHTTPEEQ